MVLRALFFLSLAGLAQPVLAQDILENAGFENGLSPWVTWGGATLSQSSEEKNSGQYSARVSGRTEVWQGTVQSILGRLQDGTSYRVSAWAMVSGESAQPVNLYFAQTDDAGENYINAEGRTIQPGVWSFLEGVFEYNETGTVTRLEFYTQGPEAGVDLYIDDVAITALPQDWVAEANARIEQIRKRDVRVVVTDLNGDEVSGAEVNFLQTERDFPIGTTMAFQPFDTSSNYRQYIIDHFNWGVHENEAKWYSNERTQDLETYAEADAILDFAEANGIKMRGHTIFWAPEQWQPDWVPGLSDEDLATEVDDRLENVVSHFGNRFEHWDVNNEMLHGSFYQDRLGPDIRKWMFERTHELQPDTRLFVNDFNILTGNRGYDYVDQIQGFLNDGFPIHAIGVQGHFHEDYSPPQAEQILLRLDRVAQFGLPVWVTEFDVVAADPELRADYLETFFRSAFSHPAVEGVVLWGFWAGSHWKGADAALVDEDWTVNAAGQRFDQLLAEWTSEESRTTSSSGAAQARLFHGRYDIDIDVPGYPTTRLSRAVKKGENTQVIYVQLDFAVEGAGPGAERGMYYDRAKDGHGIDLQKVGDNWFLVLYTYLPDGSPVWYLAVAPIEDEVFDADLLSFSYAGGVFVEEGSIGNIHIDFNDGESSDECNDGVDRASARSLAAVNVTYDGESPVSLCFEPLVAAEGVPTENYTGHWWGTPVDEGWGLTTYFQGEDDAVEFVVLYYYDGAGHPRWGLGVADNPGASSTMDLLNFEGFCLGCPVIGTVSEPMGTISHEFDPLGAGAATGTLSIDITYPGPEGGNWIREEVHIERLSDPP